VRFYAEYLPAGKYTLSYTSRVVAAGSALALPARAMEMYAPEISGTSSSRQFKSGE
jgi:uncharacterized protein YfaS (alpha-2-macroglobulin family)